MTTQIKTRAIESGAVTSTQHARGFEMTDTLIFVGLMVPSCAQAGTWFNDASVYAGLEWKVWER